MSHILKRFASFVFLAVIAFGALAATKGEKSLGLRLGYHTANKAPAAGIWFQYSFSHHFRLAPNVEYVFRHNGVDGYHFNLDAHFPIGVSRRFDIYPIAGVGFVAMYDHNDYQAETYEDNGDDVSTRTTRFALNFGAGVEYYCTRSLKLFAEGKFNWVKDFNSGVFAVGIGYVF